MVRYFRKNHDDFVNFCGSKGEVYYLHLWLQEKPQLKPLVVIELPKDVLFDSAAAVGVRTPRRSPTMSDSSFRGNGVKSSIAASVKALVEEHRMAREKSEKPDAYQAKMSKVKLDMQISRNYVENVNCLIEVKHKIESESNAGLLKILKKYEKRLTKVIDMSSSSDDSE
jgi:hypothetical protein